MRGRLIERRFSFLTALTTGELLKARFSFFFFISGHSETNKIRTSPVVLPHTYLFIYLFIYYAP